MGVQEPLVDSGKQRILFIDDEPLYLSSLRRVFSGDFDCTTVRYKNSALKLFSEAQASGKPFDAVVTDMRMPGSACSPSSKPTARQPAAREGQRWNRNSGRLSSTGRRWLRSEAAAVIGPVY